MRIEFLIRKLDSGGGQRQVVTLARALVERGHDVEVLVAYPGGSFWDRRTELGVPVISLDKRGRWDVVGYHRRLVRRIRGRRADVLYAWLTSATVPSLLLRPLLTSTAVVLAVTTSGYRSTGANRTLDLLHRVERRLARRADLVVPNSRAAGREYASTRARIDVIPNGVDTGFGPDREAGDAVRRSWDVGVGQTLVGLVGRLVPVKDGELFLDAAKELADEGADYRFVIVGAGDRAYEASLHERARALGLGDQVRFAGERHDMVAVYNALDVLALTSRTEGLPNVVVEAMTCGTPCAVVDVGDSAACARPTGEVAVERSSAAVAGAIATLVARLGREPDLRTSVAEDALGRWGLEQLVDRHLAAFEAAARARTDRPSR